MSSISGISTGITGSIMSTGMQSRTDPAEKFKQLDVDSSGALDKTELSTLAKELSKMMGKTLDVDASITTYDADGDGALSQEEMGTMMKDTLGPPPDAAGNISFSNTDKDQLATLLKMLEKMSSSSSTASAPDPAEKFAELDTDSSGGLSQTELDAMAEDFAKVTGQALDMTDAISSYDTDGDSELSQDEMDTMMETVRQNSGGPPPPPPEGVGGVSQRRAADAYLANNGEDQLDLLRQLMERLTGISTSSETDTSSTT